MVWACDIYIFLGGGDDKGMEQKAAGLDLGMGSAAYSRWGVVLIFLVCIAVDGTFFGPAKREVFF